MELRDLQNACDARISLWLLDEAHRAGSDTFTTPLTARAGRIPEL